MWMWSHFGLKKNSHDFKFTKGDFRAKITPDLLSWNIIAPYSVKHDLELFLFDSKRFNKAKKYF